eukprot:GHUV01054669.1.p2 GENE.GHUV01054669.1~~GHUV01054669.1.p2  ORF type:complete len:107 (+),score=18.98 GHUV01054669.1:385-705(+)
MQQTKPSLPAHLQNPSWQWHLCQVTHVATARMEAQHHLQLQPHTAHHLKQLLVAGPVVLPGSPLSCTPLQKDTGDCAEVVSAVVSHAVLLLGMSMQTALGACDFVA